ncbi:MAG: hypothetical protein ACK6BM_15115 [Cyanobacteriota bacterium]|jgi:hypothetical protein
MKQARWRFVITTLVLTLLYLAIQRAWMWGALQLGRSGYTVNNPVQLYAKDAKIVAEQSRQRESRLSPQAAQNVFELGLAYGYVNQWLGGYGTQAPALMRVLERPVAAWMQRMATLGEELGIGPLERLPMRTGEDFLKLNQRIEDDEGGAAGRVEQATSPRLRHLFLLGTHVGIELAALESAKRLTPIPPSALIGKHATLAGVDETHWRPLARLASGRQPEALAAYREAIRRLEQSLRRDG